MAYPGGSVTGTTGKIVQFYQRNVSNAANTTAAGAGVDQTLPINGDGTNNFTPATVTTGKLEFDAAFNSNNGGLIIDQISADTALTSRVTLVNLGGTTAVTAKTFLVFDKTIPGTGVSINSSPQDASSGIEQAFQFSFYHGGIEALYPCINSAGARDYQLNGFYVSAVENQE